MAETFLSIKDVSKSFGPVQVVKNFNLDIDKGEFVSFLGPSGCGKTTMLRMVAGFEEPTAGTIMIGDRDVTNLKPNQRNIGMVFQAYALFPNLTVKQNIGFGLKVAGVPKAEIDARVQEMLDIIKLSQFGDRYPFQLSGGQQQRIALARAIAVKPQVLLLDEPLSALDAKIRVSLRDEIRSIQRKLGITTIFVTHDQEEALSMSDRIVVMHDGKAEQIGTPFEIYNHPATRFAANFVGTLNVLDAKVLDPRKGIVAIGEDKVDVGAEIDLSHHAKDGVVALALRPEAVSLGKRKGRDRSVTGTIADVHFLGSVIRMRAKVAGANLLVDTFNDPDQAPPKRGDKVDLTFAAKDLLLLND
ncbi:MAG TPA: ABC transporter ATP-binding protein [Aestuariivirga sp.]|nr:ABC transporter ATP-binding protein [Aestuariivirga sp.]